MKKIILVLATMVAFTSLSAFEVDENFMPINDSVTLVDELFLEKDVA